MIKASIPNLDSPQAIFVYLKSLLAELGIVKVHQVACQHTEGTEKSVCCIWVGYMPQKALYVNICFNFGTFDDFKFEIHGELTDAGYEKSYENGLSHLFSEIDRSPVNSESYSGNQFDINHYVTSVDFQFNPLGLPETDELRNSEASRKIVLKISEGVDFYKRFLEGYGDLLQERFQEINFFWFVPVYSDLYRDLCKKDGEKKAQFFFNRLFLKKFPEGFFPESSTEKYCLNPGS